MSDLQTAEARRYIACQKQEYDRQITIQTEHVNPIGIFKHDTTKEELTRLLACQLAQPLLPTHNKLPALEATE